MLRRLPIAALAAMIFAASGFVAVLGTTTPALADNDDHGRSHHVNRPANPYGANGYWNNGGWRYRDRDDRRSNRHGHHGNGPKHGKHRGDRDHR